MVPMLKVVAFIFILALVDDTNPQAYNPWDGPMAVPGNVGPDSLCASGAPTSMIVSIPPDLWNGGSVGCARSMTITCVTGMDACSSTPTVTVQIVDQACTDCGERFIISQDAFFTIAGPLATTISVIYQLN